MRWLRRHRIALGLALILVIGATLRFYGLNWDQNHHLHPDERAIVAFVVPKIGMPPLREWPEFFNPLLVREATEEHPNFFDPETSPLNPHFFAYGSLPLYLLRLVANLLSLLAPLSRLLTSWPSLAQTLTTFGRVSDCDYLTILGRVLAALAGTANIYLTYLVGKRVHGSKVGLLAATFSTLTVFQIQVAHFYAVDIFLNLFVLLVIYFALGVAQGGGRGEAALLGASFGWALATKASAAPLGLVLICAFAIRGRLGKGRGWREETCLVLLIWLCVNLAFFFAQPYAILDRGSFWARVVAEGGMVRGIRDLPYTRQYAGTTPFLYQITQTTLWAMGPALGVVAWGGLLFALWRGFRHRQPSEILLLTWVVPYFLITGSFYVKFLRYMLPLFPFLYIMGAKMLLSLREWFTGWAARSAWRIVLGLVMALSLLYSLAFVSIYGRPHSRVQASEWIYRHIPPGSTLALEHWDDDLPLGMRVDGEPRSINEYRTVTMALYEPDDEAKYREIVGNLREVDYIILSSNRLYGSIPRLPQRYPITTRYYELLFDEKLGFRLIKTLTSYPGLFGLTLVDDRADESFTVYDHPKVLVFEKERDLTDEEFDRLFAKSLVPAEPERKVGKSLLLEGPVDELPVIKDRGWNRLANSHPLLSILFWWLAVEMLGLVALPLTLLVFHHLADGGYILAKTLGLLVVAYLVWLVASLRLFTNSLPTILGAGLLLGLVSLCLRRRREIIASLSSRKRVIFISEAIFSCAFLLFVGIRVLNPDLWQPWNGGEKSMEFAYLNAIVKSPYFPPYDPYCAGGYINYYYYGLHLVSILIKLTGIVPQVAFNLAIPTLFALTVSNAFSLGYNLTRKYLWGVVAPLFLAFLGNLDGLVQIAERLGDLGGLQFRSSIPGVEGLVRAIPGLVQLLLGRGTLLPFDYWRSTRVIPFTINEFPFFSFLFADLHPHMIGIPFTIFLLALVFALRRRSLQDGLFSLDSLVLVLLLGLSLGGVAVINTWDLPTYFLIILGAFLLQAWAQGGAGATVKALLASLGIVVLGLLLYLPFFTYYQPLHVGLGLVRRRTEIQPFLTIWGFFLFLIGSYLLLSLQRRLRGREALLAFGSVSLAALAFLLLKEWVLALLFPLLILAGILILSDDSQSERGFVHLLVFLGLGILLGCEVVYLRDFLQGGDYRRMNTIFKFYIQAWVLLSVAGAAVLPQLWTYLRGLRWRRLWQGAFLFLFLASSIYTVFGTQARVRDRFPGARPPLGTLDGLAFMTVGRYTWPDESNPIELRYDYEAIQWFLANVEGTPVVAEAPLPYYREGGLRVASYTGLPALVGAHQNEQRYGWMVAQREAEARSLYESTDLEETKTLIEELDVTYIYVGQLERTVYPARSLAKFDTLLEEGYLELAYENPKVRVYKVKG